MKTLQVKDFELQFKGDRDYLHGTDMYNTVTDFLVSIDPSLAQGSFRMVIHDIVHRQCRFVYMENSEDVQKPENSKVEFQLPTLTGWLVEIQTQVQGRYSYDEDIIVNKASVEDQKCILDKVVPFTTIEIIVAMNKKLLTTLFPEAEGKWYFTRLDLEKFLPEDINSFEIELVQNVHDRLTKSSIKLNGKQIGFVYFSLVK